MSSKKLVSPNQTKDGGNRHKDVGDRQTAAPWDGNTGRAPQRCPGRDWPLCFGLGRWTYRGRPVAALNT